MKLTQMEHFIAVVEEKNFTRAAERCYISRQAIGNSIKQLSRELNTDLVGLDKNNQPFVTEDGWVFYARMKDILNQVAGLKDYADERNRKEKIRIAFSDTLVPIVGKKMFHELKELQTDRNNRIDKIEQVNNNVLAAGPNCDYDLMFVMGDSSACNADTEVFFQIPIVLTVPYTNDLYDKDCLCLEDLRGQTIIYPVTKESFHLDEIAEKYGIDFQAISNLYTTGHTAIENGYCILDAEYMWDDSDLVQKRIMDFTYSWDIFAMWDKNTADAPIRKIVKKLKALL